MMEARDGREASDHNSRLCFIICECDTTGYFYGDLWKMLLNVHVMLLHLFFCSSTGTQSEFLCLNYIMLFHVFCYSPGPVDPKAAN